MDLVQKLLYGTAEGLIWGIVLLFVAFVILPEYLINPILKRLRPDLISKPKIILKFKTILDYMLNNKNIVISTEGTNQEEIEKENEFKELLKEKKSLENNLFFLDMLKSLSSILFFSVKNTGYSENATIEILKESMYYLMHYGNSLQDTSGMQNQKQRLFETTSALEEKLSDIIEFKQTASKEDKKGLLIKFQLDNSIQAFTLTMQDEYTSTENQLNQVNQILAQKFMNFIEQS